FVQSSFQSVRVQPMLATKFACPGCHVVLRTPEPVPVGQPVQCPKCGATFPMPADTPSPTGSGPQPALPQAVLGARRAAGPEFAVTMDAPPTAVKARRAGVGDPRSASGDTALQTRKRKQAPNKKLLVWASVVIGLIVVVILGAATATIIMVMKKGDETAANNI